MPRVYARFIERWPTVQVTVLLEMSGGVFGVGLRVSGLGLVRVQAFGSTIKVDGLGLFGFGLRVCLQLDILESNPPNLKP